MKKNISSNRYAVFLPIFYPTGCYSSVFTLIFPIVFCSSRLQEPHQEQGREESQQQGNSISQVPEINQAPQRKKQQEEELDQPRERSRGVVEWVCNFIAESMVLCVNKNNSIKNLCTYQDIFS